MKKAIYIKKMRDNKNIKTKNRKLIFSFSQNKNRLIIKTASQQNIK